MKKIKLFLCVALFGAMSYGAFTAYDHYTMSEEERFLLDNIEALTNDESDKDLYCIRNYSEVCIVYYVSPTGTHRTEYDDYRDQ